MSLRPHPPLLARVLSLTERRYRAPTLPASAAQARTRSAATALAFAIEHARRALERRETPAFELQELFIASLARLVGDALRPEGGDAAYQALVLRHRVPQVAEHAQWLATTAAGDHRAIRAAVGAVAHPEKLQRLPAGPLHDELSRLHEAASAGAWDSVLQVAQTLVADEALAPPQRQRLQALARHPALGRLRRQAALASNEDVQRYQALCAQQGPPAGSQQAAQQGAAAGRRGAQTEAHVVQALHRLAQWLSGHDTEQARYRVVNALLVPARFPGDASRAKGEWDAALLRGSARHEGEDLCLLVEVKAAPDAAVPDFPGLLRGLQRLSRAGEHEVHAFSSGQGEVRIRAASLRPLRPIGHALPPQVVYCCDGPVDGAPRLLSAASRGLLLSHEACLSYACRLAAENSMPPVDDLGPVWDDLLHAPRLQSVLHQYQTLRAVREAMVHPQDLLTAIAAVPDDEAKTA